MNTIRSLVILFALFVSFQYSCTGQKPWKDLSVEETKAMFDSTGVIFLDVRELEELNEDGKIEGALHINYYEDDFKSKLNELDKSKTYVVYCRSGNRSTKACGIMHELGFTKIYNVKNGYDPAIKKD